MKRFVGLDGIKGLALIAIVLYHCMQQRLPGGFYGVDVFFTVSGFLIAVSLIRSLAKTGSLNLVRYIPKRAVRLYPALFLLIPVIVSVGWLFDHDILVSIRDQVITVLLGCYNWYAIAGGQSYFDQMNPQVFRHLWFIGVLMQFYVIVPFIVWLMWKLRQTKLPSLIPLGLAAFSSIAMWVMYVPKGDPTRVYFGTDTHSMGLMLGVALAWWVTAPQLGHARQRAVPMPRTISSSASAAAHRAPLPQIPVEHRIWNAAAPVLAFLSLIALVTMAVIGKQDAFAFRGGIILSSLLSVLLIAGTISDDSWMQSLMVFKPLASPRQVFVRHLPVALAVVDSFQRPCPEDLQGSRALASHHDRVAHRHCGDDFLADGGETGGNALGGIRRGAPSHEQEESCGPGYCR